MTWYYLFTFQVMEAERVLEGAGPYCWGATYLGRGKSEVQAILHMSVGPLVDLLALHWWRVTWPTCGLLIEN
jgi:hypothetical protein